MAERQDLLWASLSTLLLTVFSIKVFKVLSWRLLLLNVLSGPAVGLLLLYQILRRPQVYAQRRTHLLAGARLLRAATSLVMGCGPQAAEFWPDRHSPGVINVLLPVSKALLLLPCALGFQLPVRHTWWIQSLVLAGSLATQQHCNLEQHQPELKHLCRALRTKLAGFFAAAFPTVLASRHWGHSGCVDPCMQVQAWGQLMVGVALPCLLLDWSELERPATCHPRHGYLLPQLSARSLAALVCYLGIFVAFAVVGWQAVEVALVVGQRVLGVHSLCDSAGHPLQ